MSEAPLAIVLPPVRNKTLSVSPQKLQEKEQICAKQRVQVGARIQDGIFVDRAREL